MFHHWMNEDSTATPLKGQDAVMSEVHCIQCGVTAPEWGYGAPYFVSVSHGSLPIWCVGQVDNPHRFIATGPQEDDDLECTACWYRITAETLPDTVEWECGAVE